MTPHQAMSFFGSQAAIVRAINTTNWPISAPSVSGWFYEGTIPPGRQYQLEALTAGSLVADRPPPMLGLVVAA